MASTENSVTQGAPAARNAPPRKQLGEVLVLQGVITSQQLATALARQKESGGSTPMGSILHNLGYVTEEDITRARAFQFGLGYAAPESYSPEALLPAEVVAIVPPEIAHQSTLMPIGRSADGGALRFVSHQWTQSNFDIAKSLAGEIGLRVEPLVATEKLLKAAIKAYYPGVEGGTKTTGGVPTKRNQTNLPAVVEGGGKGGNMTLKASDVLSAVNSGLPASAVPRTQEDIADVDIAEFAVDQPIIIQFVNKVIADAINKRASDIHFEPRRDRLEIKYRIDGSLHLVDEVPKGFQSACASRLKVMAEMNIAERRTPQDGRISVRLGGRTIDMRVSSLPTQYGEAVVLRILDRSIMLLDLDHLGFSDRNLRTLKQMISKPHGIFLATGPTGSGKTTTIYAAINRINTPDINIITVEDPIEYELDGVRQSNINERAGVTFPLQLRAILRQDPDVIYVGEIRDPETAEIAFRAALTGHLVFSTLHCNDAPGAVTRLLNMGVDPFLIASSVIGVLAQRLVRVVCPDCATHYEPTAADLKSLGIDPQVDDLSRANFQKGAGCPKCEKSGFAGRYSVQELMVMDDTIRNMTLDKAPSSKIRLAAMNSSVNPMISMRRDGAEKIMQGITTFEEIQRRVFISEEEDDYVVTSPSSLNTATAF
jgi:type IV pilus assembly protein PilB